MNSLLFFKPVLREMIWGGNRLANYGYKLVSDHTGEAWLISGVEGYETEVSRGRFTGQKLNDIYKKHRELFGNIESEEFPLLVKLIDAREDLSIQVHPDDDYAAKVEKYPRGKTECWYVVDCDEGSDIIIGHNAENSEQLAKMINSKNWKDLLNILPIEAGDFFYIPAGTLHAIRRGTLILEIQQSSDITYRVYDYDRIRDGKPRKLHIQKSIDVITCPSNYKKNIRKINVQSNAEVEKLVDCEFFSATRYDLNGRVKVKRDKPFLIVDILDGNGYIGDESLKKGDNFIITSLVDEVEFEGKLHFVVSGPNC